MARILDLSGLQRYHTFLNKKLAHFIKGTSTTNGTWLGSDDTIKEYSDGLVILYQIPRAGASTTTLNINGFGAKTIYRYGATKLTTHYGVNCIIPLVYSLTLNGGCFVVFGDYDSNSYYTLSVYSTLGLAGGLGVFQYSLFAETINGTFESFTKTGGTGAKQVNIDARFVMGKPVLYYNSGTEVKSGSRLANNVSYQAYHAVDARYTSNFKGTSGSTAFGQYKKVYLGIILNSDSTYSVNTLLLREEDINTKGYYLFIGYSYSTSQYQISKLMINNIYYYDGQNFILLEEKQLLAYAKKTELAQVATTGSYNDLTDLPSIPSIEGYAKVDYVNEKIAELINSAPETLDTLGELATALNDHNDAYNALLDLISGKIDRTELDNYVKATINANINVAGKTQDTYTYDKSPLVVSKGIIVGGTAAQAGLVTRGICGVTTPDTKTGACTKENLYVNYDGDNSYRSNRQLIIQAGTVGSHYGNNVYQYAAVRGDALKAWVEAKGYLLSSAIADWAKSANKPTYTSNEVGAAAAIHKHSVSDITNLENILLDKAAKLPSVDDDGVLSF